jgi:N-acetyl sugar amidotransferase
MSLIRTCNRCLVTESIPGVSFDNRGNCNFCEEFITRHPQSGSLMESRDVVNLAVKDISSLIAKVKNHRADYDCVVGISGGVDSSYTLVQVVQSGLRPLVVHFDNTWNSELANNNIFNLVESLGLDLHTHVADPEEYKNAVRAFLEADVIDIELIYDNAYQAVCFEMAKKHRVKYILSGMNQATEGMRFPTGWAHHNKWDKRNILNIWKRYGAKAPSIPLMSAFDWLVYRLVCRINWVPFLDYLPYDKELATKSLEDNYGYKRYPYKHYENILTRFYQGYILPEKFNVDKRIFHLSNLVVTGQLERRAALEELRKIPYISEDDLALDIRYFLKKTGLSNSELKDYLSRPRRDHSDFGEDWLLRIIRIKWLRSLRARMVKKLT